MVNGKFVRKLLAVASAAVLAVSVVMVDYCTAYAAVSITEAGEYFLRMMCSAVGVYFNHSEVGLVVDVLSHVAAQSDVINSKEFQNRMDYVLSLSPADRIDETFSNAFLADLINGFRESTVNEDGHGGGGISFPVVPSGTFVATEPFVWNLSGKDISISDLGAPVVAYVYVNYPGQYDYYHLTFVSPSPFRVNGDLLFRKTSNGYYIDGFSTYSNNPTFTLDEVRSLGAIWLSDEYSFSDFRDSYISSPDYVFPALKVSDVPAGRVWVDAFDDAALHIPAITAPITIPSDVTVMEKQLSDVSDAEDKAALYKALGAAGIAIDIGIDVPDETDKPTDAEIPDDGSVSVGKSLSDILAAITGLADKVAAIPSDIAAFFTPDMTAVSESFDSLKDSLMLKFGGLLQLADVFNRSYKFDTVIPVIRIPIPDNETLRTIFDHKTELVILDLTPFASDFQNFRSLLTAMLYVAFAFWFLDEFDVKIHIG